MQAWLSQLSDDLRRRRESDLWRQLQPTDPDGRYVTRDGKRLLNFASNDYLALTQHPTLQAAGIDAINTCGVGSGASRLVTGHQSIHERVEQRFAAWKHAEAALLLPTGYMANLAALTTLAQAGDFVCIDKLSHASLIDAARFSGATVRVYPHGNIDKLQRLLARHAGESNHDAVEQIDDDNHDARKRSPRTFIVTDSVFSMDGDVADLPALCDLADHHNAIVVVDEAHGTGILGPTGAGLCELQGVSDRVDLVISTASKALGGLGGIITAKQIVIDALVNSARPFIYTTGVPPAQAAVIEAAMDVVRDDPERRQCVIAFSEQVRQAVRGMPNRAMVRATPPTETPLAVGVVTPIVPVTVGSAESALSLSRHLATCGIHAPAIRPPTVAPNAARVRLTMRADMVREDIETLISALSRWR